MKIITAIVVSVFSISTALAAANIPINWKLEWPRTDFSKHTIDLGEVFSGGPPKDGIPSIDSPKFTSLAESRGLSDSEPVVGLVINGDARAYPLRVLMWHEIVNDTVGGVPVTVTYCPLCNSSIVFERRLNGRTLDFGTTGKLRNSDLIMYDRQTESWWQQFLGEAIVGEMTGKNLVMIPSRLESLALFKQRAPTGKVLVPTNPSKRSYGTNPYAGYDSRTRPYGFFTGPFPEGIEAMVRVVAVGSEAWSLPLLRDKGSIRAGDLEIRWQAGQNSALDASTIAKGRDVGNVVVMRNGKDVVHDVTFAFVFHAFHPNGVLHTE
ncbi:MAG: DUF3179 domain-containing protein [Rhodospirillaceae bacterium]|jgi:hypothetical protein|nr:DUF3179 domain-containing protein [Rhodospirillaceae bacterium]MBT4463987.1 DUF3179 domain-containing protein [Rhodospirillaceae bacterium]MBT5014157.1 DUF3179 domain-containing protein [Rhodospirillaceae bacterium]MBT5308506.1 DUF3179 domain-containing protein [Rhodospirillaceae bacterium]MBT7355561.1 DUF3179 domain-containing protein [Rhodospirillaceae bacterium]